MKILNFFLSIIKLPWSVLYMTIGLLAVLPYIQVFIKHIKEGGSFDVATITLFIEDRMPWMFKLGDIPEVIKIIISLSIWFWLFH